MSASNIAALAVALVIALQGAATSAESQPGADRTQSRRTAELNQLGILEYCQAHGMVDDVVVSAQREMIRSLAGSIGAIDDRSHDEEAGRAGFLSFGDRQGRFDESAAAQGITLRTACEIRAAVVPINANH